MRVIIAAAGTAGHINPGIAIANKIKQEKPNSEILFIGTNRGLENDLVPRAGYELKTIEAYGLSKKINIQNIKKMMKTIKGLGQAKKIIKEFRPDIVIGTGGYICGATILAASKQKIPTLLHESNAYPGKAVKMLASKVNTILVGFEVAKSRIPKAKNIVITGNPTKIKDLKLTQNQKEERIQKLGFQKNKKLVLVFGGSQGAKVINEALLYIIINHRNEKYQVIWATGPVQYDVIKEELENKSMNINQIKGIRIIPYIYDMEEIMNIADIVVARSGAITITEIASVGIPAIFIPLPNVSDNHQEYNAKVLETQQAAKIIKNSELNGERLNKEIENLLKQKDKLKTMGKNAKKIHIEKVEEKIYKEIQKIVNN